MLQLNRYTAYHYPDTGVPRNGYAKLITEEVEPLKRVQPMLVGHKNTVPTLLFQDVPAGEIRWSLERGDNRVNDGFTGRDLRWTTSLNRLAAVTALFGQSHVVMSEDAIGPKLSVR